MAGLLALLFFLPVSFVYGRHRARRAKSGPGGLKRRLAALLPLPLLVGACLGLAVLFHASGEGTLGGGAAIFSTGNGVVDAGLRTARLVGDLALVLFFLSLPFVLGSAVAALLLVLDARGVRAIPAEAPEPPPAEGRD